MRIDTEARSFEEFVTSDGTRLRRALVATYGVEVGSDACDEALAWAWEHWQRLVGMTNPVGYLYRVGRSAAGREHRQRRPIALLAEAPDPYVSEASVRLNEALIGLPSRQRTVALLVHGYSYSYAEVAQITGASISSIRSDLHRAMKRLRQRMESS